MVRMLRFQAGTDEALEAHSLWDGSLPPVEEADGTPGSLIRFVEAMQALLDSVPEAHRSTAGCRIEEGGDGYVISEAFYEREQTAEEAAAEERERERIVAFNAAQQLDRDRAAYERLQKVFGAPKSV